MAETKLYTFYMGLYGAPTRHVFQICIPGSYMDAIFEPVSHEESEIWTRLSHSFTKGGLLQLSG